MVSYVRLYLAVSVGGHSAGASGACRTGGVLRAGDSVGAAVERLALVCGLATLVECFF